MSRLLFTQAWDDWWLSKKDDEDGVIHLDEPLKHLVTTLSPMITDTMDQQ